MRTGLVGAKDGASDGTSEGASLSVGPKPGVDGAGTTVGRKLGAVAAVGADVGATGVAATGAVELGVEELVDGGKIVSPIVIRGVGAGEVGVGLFDDLMNNCRDLAAETRVVVSSRVETISHHRPAV
jgi:hypothetical protein